MEPDKKCDNVKSEWSNSDNEGSFIRLYLISERNEPETLTKRVSLSTNLSSRVGKEGFTVRVLPCGCKLEFTVSRPTQLVDMKTLHKKWIQDPLLKYEMHQREPAGFCGI